MTHSLAEPSSDSLLCSHIICIGLCRHERYRLTSNGRLVERGPNVAPPWKNNRYERGNGNNRYETNRADGNDHYQDGDVRARNRGHMGADPIEENAGRPGGDVRARNQGHIGADPIEENERGPGGAEGEALNGNRT